MLKIKDNVDLKELEKYGFETFYVEHKQSLFATKDIYIDRPNKITPDWYRIGVDEVNVISTFATAEPVSYFIPVM